MKRQKKLVVGNWKTNPQTLKEAKDLTSLVRRGVKGLGNTQVVLCPPFLYTASLLGKKSNVSLGAQDAFYESHGPYTGEVSSTQLSALGVDFCIVGHSERRLYFNEDLDIVRDKVAAAVRNGIMPILCVGETDHERKDGETRQVLHDQLTTALANLTASDVEDIVIAYEPVWAISTFGGVLAKPDDVAKDMAFIRKQIADLYGKRAASRVRILYGGSVDDQIVRGYLEIEDCDGVLVGGASLNYHKFSGIVGAAYRLRHETGEDE